MMMPMPGVGVPDSVFPEERSREQKPKTLPCRHCQKRFRRLEHVQRHERTHTKEKPFACACGKTFGRRDLLVRHEKLVHQVESSRASRSAHSHAAQAQRIPPDIAIASPAPAQPPLPHPPLSSSSSNFIDPDLLTAPARSFSDPQATLNQGQDHASHQRTPGYSLDLLSDAANHIASSDSRIPRHRVQMNAEKQQHQSPYRGSGRDDAVSGIFKAGPTGSQGLLEDYNALLDGFASSNYLLSSSAPNSEVPASTWYRPELSYPNPASHHEYQQSLQYTTPKIDGSVSSGFGSITSSRQTDFLGHSETSHPPSQSPARTGPPWKISAQDYRGIQSQLDEFSCVLPKDFRLPTRHTLSRFLEGYINGYHEHMPFLHIPTFAATKCAPELLLALVAVGAQYRFESHKGNELWVAAKAIAIEQVHRRNGHHVLGSQSPSANGMDAISMSPTSSPKQDDGTSHRDHSKLPTPESEPGHSDPRLKPAQARLETIQALLLLITLGNWGPKSLSRQSALLESQLILLIREQGLSEVDIGQASVTWEDWIKFEAERRTKLFTYCLFNLQCIAYDTPPLLLNSDMKLTLPRSSREWMIGSTWQWHEFQRTNPQNDVNFHDALTTLFSRSAAQDDEPPISSLGNCVLIHALTQHIFFVRQTSAANEPTTRNNGLKPEQIEPLGHALKNWQVRWERNPESSLDPSNPHAVVALNSLALWRLACIRLHSDLGPCRRLDSREPHRVAMSLQNSPLLVRSPFLSLAVLQSAHALSLPVKIGANTVARTQAFSWSIQHSLCNLECAFLLCKWLETIASSSVDLGVDERNLVELVKGMLDETEFAVAFDARESLVSSDERARFKELGAAVVRLWAEAYRGTHVLSIVKVIGSSLETYADLMEKANDVAAADIAD